MSQPTQSPSYNILAPKPWTSFKETPPSPLLVLQRRDSRKGAAEEGVTRGSSKKKRAPQPPVRASSLSSQVSVEESDRDHKHPADTTETTVTTSETTETLTTETRETRETGLEESVKTEISISVTRHNEDEVNVDDVDDVDAKIHKHPQPELILDVQKLQNIEDVVDKEETMKSESSEDVDDITEPLDSVDEKLETGKRLSIVDFSGFIEGFISFRSNLSNHMIFSVDGQIQVN